jgi:hypothetical protein
MAKLRNSQGTIRQSATRRTAPSVRKGPVRPKSHAMGDFEKAFYIAIITFAVVLSGLLAHGASGASERHGSAIVARHVAAYAHSAAIAGPRGPVYDLAMILAAKYDSRPYWPGAKLVVGQPVSRATADLAIEYLIPCESGGQLIDHLDSNGKMSYGILQFQDWDEWERTSGISGNPENRDDAIRMAEWGIEHGMIYHWGCARILHMM